MRKLITNLEKVIVTGTVTAAAADARLSKH